MIPKSVSGTSRIIALGAVLTWPVWGWAGELDFRYTHPNGTLIECGNGVCKADGMQLSKYVDCYQRMREVMKVIGRDMQVQIPDEYKEHVKGVNVFHSPKTLRQWNTVMKECVEGGK